MSKFITFEGVDGAGKSTHLEWFADALRQRGLDVVVTREPGGTPLGEQLREILLNQTMSIGTEALLMFAARLEHIEQVIKPALSAGKWVISDRFSDASFAYQGGGRGLDWDKLKQLEQWVHGDLQPDLTLFFDVPVEVARQRLGCTATMSRWIASSRSSADFFERVRAGYHRRVQENPQRYAVIDGAQTCDMKLNINLKKLSYHFDMKHIYPWQKNDLERLQELRKRPPHGVLFKGAKGIGKFDLAMNFAQSLLCQHPDEADLACGKCSSCHWFEQESHPDFRLLQPEALSLDGEESENPAKSPANRYPSIRCAALADFFGMSAHQGGRRVVVIHPAEAMNTNAANALLKNLEEPPPGLLFILVSHKPQQLLPTILSRCLSFALPAPDAASATRWLAGTGRKKSRRSACCSPVLHRCRPFSWISNWAAKNATNCCARCASPTDWTCSRWPKSCRKPNRCWSCNGCNNGVTT